MRTRKPATRPVQFESFPRKWDPAHAQRAMENNLRRVLASMPEEQPEATPTPANTTSHDIEALLFVGLGTGRQILAP